MSATYAITVVTETYPPEINGVANTMRHLVTGLAARGHRLRIVRPRQGGETAPPDGGPETLLVPGLPIPGYPGLRFGLPAARRLRRAWETARPDLVYIATEGPLGHAALRAARAVGIATLTGFHTRFEQYSPHYGLGFLARPIARALRSFHNGSDATLVPTAELRDRLLAQGYARVEVFGRGVDTDLFSPARRREALRAAWGCGPDDPVLLFVGRLAAEKNIHLALEAYAAARAVSPRARCVLVGDGPERGRLVRAHPELICPGMRVGEALAEHYASADLFVFPSLTETYGNVVAEAMASGLAVVAFDDAAAHHLIRDGENGAKVARGDRGAFIEAAARAAADPPRRQQWGKAARATAETLGWERVIDGIEHSIRDAIERRAGAAGCPGAAACST